MNFTENLEDYFSENVRVCESGNLLFSIMINEDKEDHEKADKEGAFSGKSSDIVSKIGGNWHLFNPWLFSQRQFPLNLIIVECIIQIYFLFDFFFHTY